MQEILKFLVDIFTLFMKMFVGSINYLVELLRNFIG